MPITALYVGLLAPLFILLSARVIGRRREAALMAVEATHDGGTER